MVSDATTGGGEIGDAIARRFGQSAADDWQRLLARFEFGSGFALVVLLVPDRDGAGLCRTELERVLRAGGQAVYAVAISTPTDLVRMAAGLPNLTLGADVGAVWFEAAVAHSASDFPQWENAWRRALEGLNQQRNPLRAVLQCPVVVVGAPWVVPLFRELAPDLWSVRAQVIRIEPQQTARRGRLVRDRQAVHGRDEPIRPDAPDPEFALHEAERLRGQPDRVWDRAVLLVRAAQGLLARGRPKEAEAVLRYAPDLPANSAGAIRRSDILHELGRAVRNQGRAAEAEGMFRQALALKEQGGDTAASRGSTTHELGRAILDQGRAAEAEAMFRHALALKEQGSDTATSRGVTTDDLGRAILDQGDAAEAEAIFRQALSLKVKGGDTSTSRGITEENLGQAILFQGRMAEAEAMFRQALALKEQGGDTATSRGGTAGFLAWAILEQGRAAEAEAMFRSALALEDEGGDVATFRAVTLDLLGQAILSQGRTAEAETMFHRALALAEEGNAPGEIVSFIRRDLDLAGKALAG